MPVCIKLLVTHLAFVFGVKRQEQPSFPRANFVIKLFAPRRDCARECSINGKYRKIKRKLVMLFGGSRWKAPRSDLEDPLSIKRELILRALRVPR